MKDKYLNYELISNYSMYELAKFLFPFPRSLTGEGIKALIFFVYYTQNLKQLLLKVEKKLRLEIPNQWEQDGYIELENGSKFVNSINVIYQLLVIHYQ